MFCGQLSRSKTNSSTPDTIYSRDLNRRYHKTYYSKHDQEIGMRSRAYEARPEVRERRRARRRELSKDASFKEKRRQYDKKYRSTTKYKERRQEYRRRPEVRERQILREARKSGYATLPKHVRILTGEKIDAKRILNSARLGTADMTSLGSFKKNPEKAVRRDYRSFRVMPIYRRARMKRDVANLSALPVSEIAAQRKFYEENTPSEVAPRDS